VASSESANISEFSGCAVRLALKEETTAEAASR
jgi:hypothetical protein